MTRPAPSQTRTRYRQRAPLMFLAVLALLAGLWAGLLRLGWQLPPLVLHLPVQHGPLMVSGFLGTLNSLERAVALSQNQNGRRRYYLAPLLAGLGAVTLLFDLPTAVPRGQDGWKRPHRPLSENGSVRSGPYGLRRSAPQPTRERSSPHPFFVSGRCGRDRRHPDRGGPQVGRFILCQWTAHARGRRP